MKEYSRKNSLRLQGYDYSSAGCYFITICSAGGEWMFGEIVDGKMVLNECGVIVYEELMKTAKIRDFLLETYVIMPNHLYFVANLPRSQPKKNFIPTLVQAYKAAVSRRLAYDRIRHYIKMNPATWEKDRFYCKPVS